MKCSAQELLLVLLLWAALLVRAKGAIIGSSRLSFFKKNKKISNLLFEKK